jgi:dienelactone hydrolase
MQSLPSAAIPSKLTLAGAVLACLAFTQPMHPAASAALAASPADRLAPFWVPPAQYAGQFGSYKTLLQFNDGSPVRTPADWTRRRAEILALWQKVLGPWPPLIPAPKLEFLQTQARENFTQHRVRLEIASNQFVEGFLLVPPGAGPFPAVLVPYYEPETSVGLSKQDLRDFGYQLVRRGFVTLSIGSPGSDARKPDITGAQCQPLSFLAYVAANCHTALARMTQVDPARIGIVAHSYGGKWAMFSACLYDKFACGVWSDPGIVFDESRPNVNYWEPWYLGEDPAHHHTPGVPTADNARTGAYKTLFEAGHDLHELLALMAPRPFLVSGGSEDPLSRWLALNRVLQVYELLGVTNRVALTSRKDHTPTPESNEQIYSFFELFLRPRQGGPGLSH